MTDRYLMRQSSSFLYLINRLTCSKQIDRLIRQRMFSDAHRISFFFQGNASLISEALRHYQRVENEHLRGEKKHRKKSDQQQTSRRHYHIKECKIRPIVIHQAVTQKIKVDRAS